MPTVYIETSIPSFYFDTRTSARVVAWRAATRSWWAQDRKRYDIVTSSFVLNELSRAPRAKAVPAIDLLSDVHVLDLPDRLEEVVSAYVRNKIMPADAVGDAAHLAMASLHGVEFLLTWNCKHLANANKVPHIRAINESLGLTVPILTTPFALTREGPA